MAIKLCRVETGEVTAGHPPGAARRPAGLRPGGQVPLLHRPARLQPGLRRAPVRPELPDGHAGRSPSRCARTCPRRSCRSPKPPESEEAAGAGEGRGRARADPAPADRDRPGRHRAAGRRVPGARGQVRADRRASRARRCSRRIPVEGTRDAVLVRHHAAGQGRRSRSTTSRPRSRSAWSTASPTSGSAATARRCSTGPATACGCSRPARSPPPTPGDTPSRTSGWIDLERVQGLGAAGRRVAADVPRGLAAPARALLDRGHVRARLGRDLRALPAAGRPGHHPLRVLRPALGAAGRAGHLARLRDRRRVPPRPDLHARASSASTGSSTRRPGGYRIGRIVEGDPWDPAATSPLNRPGRRRPGRRRGAGGQRPAGRRRRHARRAAGQPGRPGSRCSRSSAATRRPARSRSRRSATSRPARYRDWVEANRRAVHEATDGRVGYIHIPDMGPEGYAEFHRGYLVEYDREALIVDVRYNGGGHVSQPAAGEAGPAPPRLRLPALGRARAVPGRVAARPDGGAHQRAGRLGRRHLQPHLQAAGARAAGRQAHLGRRDRHLAAPHPGRRHADHAAGVLVLLRRRRLAASRTTAPTRTSRSTTRRRTTPAAWTSS